MRFWTVTVSTLTLTAFTGAGILEERRQLLETEAGHASALLEHLAHMPEFQGSAGDAARRLELLHGSLSPVSGTLELGIPGSGKGQLPWTVLARRRLPLRDAELEMRYRADPVRLSRLTRRAVVIHSVHGLVALAALLAGTEWILRRKLVAPLHAISHEVALMRDGRGWAPRLPGTDEELRELSEALRGLGPGLEQQVREWIEAERRGAVALALARTRRPLREARGRVLQLLAELEGAWVEPPLDRERRIRSLAEEIERIQEIVEAEALPVPRLARIGIDAFSRRDLVGLQRAPVECRARIGEVVGCEDQRLEANAILVEHRMQAARQRSSALRGHDFERGVLKLEDQRR